MARTVSIGNQDFASIREGGYLFVDKTGFLRDWWASGDSVTLVCRPRRFGKTLTLSMAECFFSNRFAGWGNELFEGLEIWGDPDFRALQGTLPVVSLSFAKVKRQNLGDACRDMKQIIYEAVRKHSYLLQSDSVTDAQRDLLMRVSDTMDDATATTCLGRLCDMLEAHWGSKPIILLDEYDTPMQEAWTGGYWDDMASFMRSLFNATFKSNTSLGRALITGITRVASESIFSDMNNLAVATVTSPKYETAFGFTGAEVDGLLRDYGREAERKAVREWYDGFTFGGTTGIYNPWSITNYLDQGRIAPYWVNTSSNGLVSSTMRRADPRMKEDLEALLAGESIPCQVNEYVTFDDLDGNAAAVWSLLLATGYVKPDAFDSREGTARISLTNREIRSGFDAMVRRWFAHDESLYNGFTRALLAGDVDAMTDYLSDLALGVMSSFDSGVRPARDLPERFWHGLVLGLLVGLRGRYEVRSQPESGYGRCDVVLFPLDGRDGKDPAVVLEFKVVNSRRGEQGLEDAVAAAHAQIQDRAYASALVERGIAPERIHEYGIAFQGKEVLVG